MRLLPIRAVKACAAICALTLTSLSPLVLTPPAGADQPARDGELPRLGVEARGIDGVHAPSLTRLAVRHALSVELALEPCEC